MLSFSSLWLIILQQKTILDPSPELQAPVLSSSSESAALVKLTFPLGLNPL